MLSGMDKRRDSAGRWREILRRQADSGLSVAAFCRQAGISQPSFYVWRRRLREAGNSPEVRDAASSSGVRNATGLSKLREAETFTEVNVAPGRECIDGGAASNRRRPEGALELVLGGGRSLVVRPGFDRATLLALVATLEGDSDLNGRVKDAVKQPADARRKFGA